MAKLRCLCGLVMSDGAVPSPIVSWLISDAHAHAAPEPLDYATLCRSARAVWHCRDCGRLAVDEVVDGKVRIRWYRPEEPT